MADKMSDAGLIQFADADTGRLFAYKPDGQWAGWVFYKNHATDEWVSFREAMPEETTKIIQQLRDRVDELRATNGRLQADLMDDKEKERLRDMIAEHSVVDGSLWDALLTQRNEAQAQLAAVTKERDGLKPKAELWQRIVDWVDVEECRQINTYSANADFNGANYAMSYSTLDCLLKGEAQMSYVFGDTRADCLDKIEAATQPEDSDDESQTHEGD